jgi:phosphate transport system protein
MLVRTKYDDELMQVRSMVHEMGRHSVDFVQAAVEALAAFDVEKAKECRTAKQEIYKIYAQLDTLSLRLLATQQPIASDLRLLVSSMKIATEIQQIAAYANHIAKKAQNKIPHEQAGEIADRIRLLGDIASGMLEAVILAYDQNNIEQVEQVISQAKILKAADKAFTRDFTDTVSMEFPAREGSIQLFTAARHIHRIGRRAVNIAKLVFFIAKGVNYPAKNVAVSV